MDGCLVTRPPITTGSTTELFSAGAPGGGEVASSTLKVNEVISSLLHYKASLSNCTTSSAAAEQLKSSEPFSVKLETPPAGSCTSPPHSIMSSSSLLSRSGLLSSTAPFWSNPLSSPLLSANPLVSPLNLLPGALSLNKSPLATLPTSASSFSTPAKKMAEQKKNTVVTSSAGPGGQQGGGGGGGVKIFQTKQGYTLLICNGYRYSKISTSSNGKKVYWRCTLRSCKGKVHTDIGGGVVYESTHDHPPMAEEFLFSCHSNRLAKEARQIMRFDPMKALKDDAPYSALESTPTFCKIKDRLGLKKEGGSPERMGVEPPTLQLGTSSPLKDSSPPTPHPNLGPAREGSFKVSAPTCNLLSELHALRLTHHLCDVALCVNGSLIYAHRVVLAAASQYFRLLFLNNSKVLSYVELQGVSPDCVELLVNFAYTGDLNINYARVTEMLTAANLLHFTVVVERCCEYLRTRVTPANVIKMREFIYTQGLTKFQNLLDRYIFKNWPLIIQEEEVYDARPETLLHLLEQDELVVDNEADVYKVIITWVRRSPLYRQLYVGELLRKVRLVQLNAQFLLDNVESEEIIRQHRDCEALLHRAKNHFLLPERDHGLEEYHFRKRKRRQNMCLLGRADRSESTVLLGYDPARSTLSEISRSTLPVTDYALVNCNNTIYAIGGVLSDGKSSRSILRYDLPSKQWTNETCQLLEPRAKAAAVQIGHQIVVIGGESATGGALATVEHVDLHAGTVTPLPALPSPVSGPSAAVMGDSIFLMGDVSGQQMVFVFTKSRECWEPLPPVPRRALLCCPTEDSVCLMEENGALLRLDGERWDTVPHPTTTLPDSSRITAALSLDGDVYAVLTNKETLPSDRAHQTTTTELTLRQFCGTSRTWLDSPRTPLPASLSSPIALCAL